MRARSIILFLCLVGCGEEAELSAPGFGQDAITYGSAATGPAAAAVAALSYFAQIQQGPVTISGNVVFCSGTLIGPRVVLTAAHCLRPEFDETNGTVFFGGDTDESGQRIAVADRLAHPDYDDATEAHDIALVELAEAPEGIAPLPVLPPEHGLGDADLEQDVRLVGFGLSEAPYVADGPIEIGTRREVSAPIVAVCNQLGACANGLSVHRFAFDHDGRGTCSGDSGGPATIVRNGVEYVCGVHSTIQADPWSAHPELPDCVNAAYGIETIVDAHAPFIAAFVRDRGLELAGSCTATCDGVASCEQRDGTYACICPAGYDDVNGDGTECVDIDECALTPCDLNASCANQAGTFECACQAGFAGDGLQCTDIDECASGRHDCSDQERCENLVGSFRCIVSGDGDAGNGSVVVENGPEAAAVEVGACGELCVIEGVSSCRSAPPGSLLGILLGIAFLLRRRR